MSRPFSERGRKSLLECALAPVGEAMLISVPGKAVRQAQAGNCSALHEALGPRQQFRSAECATLGQVDGHEYVFVFHGFRDSGESDSDEVEHIRLITNVYRAVKSGDEDAERLARDELSVWSREHPL